MTRVATMLLMALLALAGCGPIAEQAAPSEPSETRSAPAGDLPTSEPVPSDVPGTPVPTADPRGETVTGTLGGDDQLEGGCVWIETADGTIEPMLPDGYTATTGPVAIVGPDGGVIAEQGDRVTIVGTPAVDVMTTCQVGAVWRVSAVKAA